MTRPASGFLSPLSCSQLAPYRTPLTPHKSEEKDPPHNFTSSITSQNHLPNLENPFKGKATVLASPDSARREMQPQKVLFYPLVLKFESIRVVLKDISFSRTMKDVTPNCLTSSDDEDSCWILMLLKMFQSRIFCPSYIHVARDCW